MRHARRRLLSAPLGVVNVTIGGTVETAQAGVPAEMATWAKVIQTGNIKRD